MANRIPLGYSSSTFACPTQISCAHLAGHTPCFLESWRCTGSGSALTHSLGSAALGPYPVSCVGITFCFVAILKVLCLKHFPGKWGTRVQPLALPRGNCSFHFPHPPTPTSSCYSRSACSFCLPVRAELLIGK